MDTLNMIAIALSATSVILSSIAIARARNTRIRFLRRLDVLMAQDTAERDD